MKKVCILTATRAEYGLLKPIINKLKKIKDFDVRVVVTGAHLSPEFGYTYKDIEKDGIEIDEKIEILLDTDTPSAVSKSMGLALINFSDYFKKTEPDLLLVLGDRYETLAVCIAAMNQLIPIGHLHGGETTQGAVDESIRHSITKLSHLHFTSAEEHRKRVIQLGEYPERVFNVGATGVENILNEKLLSKQQLEESIDFKLNKEYALVTYHPVTLERSTEQQNFQNLLNVITKYKHIDFIFTKANADAGGRIINKMIDSYVQNHDNAIAFTSLGLTRYLSALKYCSIVIGNSSSGIIEAPSFGIPTINIGDRQKGRMQSNSIINCEPTVDELTKAISKALSNEFVSTARKTINPYGQGNTSNEVVSVITKYFSKDKLDLKKEFYDLG